MSAPNDTAFQQQNSFCQEYIIPTLKTREGVKDLIHEAEAAIQAAEDGKHELEENAEQFEDKVELFSKHYLLQRVTGEWSHDIIAAVAQWRSFGTLQWGWTSFEKNLEMRNKMIEKANLVKYLSERMQELLETLPTEEIGQDKIMLEGGDFRQLLALGNRIDVAERDFAAVREEQAETMRLDAKANEFFFEWHELEAKIASSGLDCWDEATADVEKNVARLKQKLKDMRKETTIGLERY